MSLARTVLPHQKLTTTTTTTTQVVSPIAKGTSNSTQGNSFGLILSAILDAADIDDIVTSQLTPYSDELSEVQKSSIKE